MIILNIYKDIDKDNTCKTYRLSNHCYSKIRQQLKENYTILAHTDRGNLTGELVDDNI